MALERFIPKSPDMFIRNSQDFEVAKFGHLNTIVEYINSYIDTDSLQLAGSGPITSIARYITDATGVNSAISISTNRVGIGTDTPSAELHIDGHNGFGYSLRISTNKVGGIAYAGLISDYITGFEQYQYGGPGWGWPNWTTTRAGGTAAAPTAVPSNYGLNEYTFWGHDGTAGGQAYAMMTRTSETWTPTAHGIYTTFSTVATGSISLVERMRFSAGGNITFNNASDTAKVSIKGSGSTSATTSLLIQNSAGTAALTVRDDLYVFGGSRVYSTGNMYMDGNTGTLFSAWGQLQLQGASYVQIMNDTLRAGSQNFNFTNTSFSPNNSTNSNLILSGNGSSFTNVGAGSTSVGNVLSIPIGLSTSTGNVTLNHININGTINTTAGTTLQRGFYYNPTLTSTVGFTHNAIETTTGDVLLGTTSGKVLTGYLGVMGSPINQSMGIHLSGSQVFQVGNPIVTDQFMVIDSVAGSKRGIKFGNQGSTRQGLFLNNNDLQIAECNATNYNPWLTVDYASSGNVTIGAGATTSIGAKLGVRGSGSTSATTSLLVQNSGGTNLLQVKDNGDLLVGTVASGLGTIYVPHDASYGTRGFLAMQNGGNVLMSTVSNSQLLLNGNMFNAGSLYLTAINYGIVGKSAFSNNNTSIVLQGDVNAYNGTNQDDASNIVLLGNTNNTLQANGSMNFLKITGSVNEGGGGGAKFLCGIYYKATITGGTALDNSHYCYWATSGQMMVNTTSPNSSAQLQVDSTTRGFLMPRMTTTQINAIVSPANGLEVYNTTLAQPCFYDGIAWRKVTHSTM